MIRILLVIALGLVTGRRAEAAAPRETVRVAVVVGATGAAQGRAALTYSHRDAEQIADVLVAVGGFPADRVHVLRDPAPAELLALLERAASAVAGERDAMLFFYFSGHADRRALYSGGRAVPLEAVRAALDRSDIAVRIGVIDACQGGGWTRAKGLVPDAPFEVSLPQLLESEGSALIASSTGDESAHESDALAGSFFTVHLAAGLRGAADESGDGAVTLTEAFQFARQQTIRDTARRAGEPQHPSFALNLRGRQDVVLAQVAASPSTIALEQAEGPLELVHLASGLKLLELPPGPRTVRLAVPPGRYLVRRLAPDGVRVHELSVPRQGTAALSEGDLVLVPSERLVVKGELGRPSRAATPDRGDWQVSLGLVGSSYANAFDGVQTGDWSGAWSGTRLQVDGRVGITDRLTWKLGTLAFAYRFGDSSRVEVVPYAGALAWHIGSTPRVTDAGRVGAGTGIRLTEGSKALVGTIGVELERKRTYQLRGSAGYEFGSRLVTFHLGIAHVREIGGYYGSGSSVWLVGSVQDLGLETLPLARVHLPNRFSLDLHAARVVASSGRRWAPELTAGAGLTRTF
jgi:hypothetical protein